MRQADRERKFEGKAVLFEGSRPRPRWPSVFILRVDVLLSSCRGLLMANVLFDYHAHIERKIIFMYIGDVDLWAMEFVLV